MVTMVVVTMCGGDGGVIPRLFNYASRGRVSPRTFVDLALSVNLIKSTPVALARDFFYLAARSPPFLLPSLRPCSTDASPVLHPCPRRRQITLVTIINDRDAFNVRDCLLAASRTGNARAN